DQEVTVETSYVQLARAEGAGWSLRLPLTTAPRYVRSDEAGSRPAAGQPLGLLRDPGHRFALDLAVLGADVVDSSTHPLEVPREVVLLVDHSGSMQGPKWQAADWAVERFLTDLTEQDAFALGLFHTTTQWFAKAPRPADPRTVGEGVAFLKAHRDSGGTELGV